MMYLRTFEKWLVVSIFSTATLVAVGPAARLADAAEKMDRASVRVLLQERVDVNEAQIDGMTALHWAAYQDDLETMKLLLDAGANIKAANRYGVTPLSLACTNANETMVELLLEAGADPNTALRGGETVLMTSARTGKLGTVKALLSRGADVNAKVGTGQTALIWAVSEGHVEVVEELLKAGAEFLSPLVGSGFTPLLFAVRDGRSDVVQVLLKAGADVNEIVQRPDGSSPRLLPGPAGRAARNGSSPLILAVENGHFELAVQLLEAGADPNDQRSGLAPLHRIPNVRKPNRGDGGSPSPEGSGNLSSLEFVKALVAHGGDVSLRVKKAASRRNFTRLGATPFFLASVTADVPLMRTLVELGADPLLPNAEGCTPLLAASGIGVGDPGASPGTEPEVLEALQLLLELGADINKVDDNGETVMHGTAYKHLPKAVQFLADNGAKIEIWNQKNNNGWTPWLIAEGHRFGNFRPGPETMAAIGRAMNDSGVPPPTKRRARIKKIGYGN